MRVEAILFMKNEKQERIKYSKINWRVSKEIQLINMSLGIFRFEPVQGELASQQTGLRTQKRNAQNSKDFIRFCFIQSMTQWRYCFELFTASW